ncbi:MAG: hypothetical protein AAF546_07210, partial [Verrucomicrobiota bacterium]
SKKMKLILTFLSWFYLVIGLLALSLPIAVLSSAFRGEWNSLSLFMMLPSLFLAIGLIWISITFLREKRENIAESMATLTGILLWITINTKALDYLDMVDDRFGALAGFGVILLPIIVGVGATKSMKFFIRRAYEQKSDQGGVINSESLRSST